MPIIRPNVLLKSRLGATTFVQITPKCSSEVIRQSNCYFINFFLYARLPFSISLSLLLTIYYITKFGSEIYRLVYVLISKDRRK